MAIKAPLETTGRLVETVIPRNKINGDAATTESGYVIMPTMACGIRNQGAGEITLLCVPANADETNTTAIKVPAGGESTTVGLFRAVKIAGSTGSQDATTEYLLTV